MLEHHIIQLLLTILPRILCASLCGALIGLERDVHGRAAGLRTHTLVSAGSALFTVISIMISNVGGNLTLEAATSDTGRIAAQIVSGIGFLGAGTIVKAGLTVKGLTTAACLWFVAALGMTCGIGLYSLAISVTVIGLLIIYIGKSMERILLRQFPFQLIVETTDQQTVAQVRDFLEQDNKNFINSIDITHNCDSHHIRAVFYMETKRGKKQPENCLELLDTLKMAIPNLQLISYRSEGQP